MKDIVRSVRDHLTATEEATKSWTIAGVLAAFLMAAIVAAGMLIHTAFGPSTGGITKEEQLGNQKRLRQLRAPAIIDTKHGILLVVENTGSALGVTPLNGYSYLEDIDQLSWRQMRITTSGDLDFCREVVSALPKQPTTR
ncbi:MAG: hypothetical protein A2542_02435 [Parcubacteria group bacterium RIFOXYD2_FULL_52_8]|nr:MAG: hypothetical protein A2542_02435 [Parcubacteria group bacterium RIFOXYD2_FULL_52_8]